MAKYVYPAVFHPNSDGSITVTFPDLPGCISEGKNLENALYMAQDALTQWIMCAAENDIPVSEASVPGTVTYAEGEFVSMIRVDITDTRDVNRTVSIPKWMDEKAAQTGLSLSLVLQDALRERLGAR
ncbi:MAG: type II toxin-antitoxin system HicB family antitoxin [Oscillospiraceae bacterium]|nr:type II toxin-antitoxin system HicB family antitoxin [Oscillospiraceae bacterium]